MNAIVQSVKPWYHIQRGEGRPLVLLHGIGMSHHAWLPVIDQLAAQGRRVIAFDIAGFGRSAPVPHRSVVGIARLARELRQNLALLGIHEPVDIAGNSLGGRIAIELAQQGGARSVVAISPPGLWPALFPPPVMLASFAAIRFVPQLFPGLTYGLLKSDVLRAWLLKVPMAAHGKKISAEDAIDMTRRFTRSRGFWPTALGFTRINDTSAVTVPCTIAYGQQDLLLPRMARRRDAMPRHTEWLEPYGWGHVPMWDDPEGVVRLILSHTA